MISVVVPGAGGLVSGFSIRTWTSALFAAWFSSVMATSMELAVAEMTLTPGSLTFTSSPLAFFWGLIVACHTFSAASLLHAVPASRYWSTYSRSLNYSCSGGLSWTALHATSCGLGAGVIGISAGRAGWGGTLARKISQPSFLPGYRGYFEFPDLANLFFCLAFAWA